jgi:hypothetical protein
MTRDGGAFSMGRALGEALEALLRLLSNTFDSVAVAVVAVVARVGLH